MAITVSLVEGSQELRKSLAASLNNSATVRCDKCYASSEDALREIPLAQPDVILIDINLSGTRGIECVVELKAKLPRLRVLMLTRFEQTELVFDSICAGADGYLLKNTPGAEMVEAIEQIYACGSSMSMQIARKALQYLRSTDSSNHDPEKLTAREEEILTLLAKGDSSKDVSAALNTGTDTVLTHLHSIYGKIHINSKHRKTKPMKKSMKTPRPFLALAASLLLTAFWLLPARPALAQVGSSWTQQTFSERFEYESNDVLLTISPPPGSFTLESCWSFCWRSAQPVFVRL